MLRTPGTHYSITLLIIITMNTEAESTICVFIKYSLSTYLHR